MVLEQRQHAVGAQAVRIVRIIPVADEFLPITVEFEKSGAACPHPQDALLVFVNRPHARFEPAVRSRRQREIREPVVPAIHF